MAPRTEKEDLLSGFSNYPFINVPVVLNHEKIRRRFKEALNLHTRRDSGVARQVLQCELEKIAFALSEQSCKPHRSLGTDTLLAGFQLVQRYERTMTSECEILS